MRKMIILGLVALFVVASQVPSQAAARRTGRALSGSRSGVFSRLMEIERGQECVAVRSLVLSESDEPGRVAGSAKRGSFDSRFCVDGRGFPGDSWLHECESFPAVSCVGSCGPTHHGGTPGIAHSETDQKNSASDGQSTGDARLFKGNRDRR